MSTLSFTHVVRDASHGNIPFTDLERRVIDHPLFQRLREISQLGFLRLVFPSASHSRFEHSLGVMHLSGRLAEAVAANLEKLAERAARKKQALPPEVEAALDVPARLRSPEALSRIRLAGLLHDLGHGPYSHASEVLTAEVDRGRFVAALPDFWRKAFSDRLASGGTVGHESFTVLLAARLAEDLGGEAKDAVLDAAALVDDGLPLTKGSPLAGKGLRSLAHALISGEADADRMDYLSRDSRASGVSYGLFDVDRLVSALSAWRDASGELHPLLSGSGLHSFEDYLVARYQMYMQVYTHKTNTAFEAMFTRLLRGMAFPVPVDAEGFLKLRDGDFATMLRERIESSSVGSVRAGRLALYEGLFERRKPWKLVYEENSFGDAEEEAAADRRFEDFRRNRGDGVETWTARRTLSKLTEGAEKPGLRVLRSAPDGSSLRIADPLRSSYMLDAFRRTVTLRRAYAPGPD